MKISEKEKQLKEKLGKLRMLELAQKQLLAEAYSQAYNNDHAAIGGAYQVSSLRLDDMKEINRHNETREIVAPDVHGRPVGDGDRPYAGDDDSNSPDEEEMDPDHPSQTCSRVHPFMSHDAYVSLIQGDSVSDEEEELRRLKAPTGLVERSDQTGIAISTQSAASRMWRRKVDPLMRRSLEAKGELVESPGPSLPQIYSKGPTAVDGVEAKKLKETDTWISIAAKRPVPKWMLAGDTWGRAMTSSIGYHMSGPDVQRWHNQIVPEIVDRAQRLARKKRKTGLTAEELYTASQLKFHKEKHRGHRVEGCPYCR